MDHHVLKRSLLAVVVGVVLIIIVYPRERKPEPVAFDDKTPSLVEMKMIPVDGVPGEYILEYSNGEVELLKTDGTKVAVIKLKEKTPGD